MLPTRGSSVRRHGIGIDEIVSIHCSFSPRVVWYTHIHIQRHRERERERERKSDNVSMRIAAYLDSHP